MVLSVSCYVSISGQDGSNVQLMVYFSSLKSQAFANFSSRISITLCNTGNIFLNDNFYLQLNLGALLFPINEMIYYGEGPYSLFHPSEHQKRYLSRKPKCQSFGMAVLLKLLS